MSLQFGSFQGVCEQVALSLCPYINKNEGVEPICYSRNVEIAGTLIFQPATLIIHFIALVMTSVMIYHIKAKYTAVGRKEIVMFFYMYMACTFCEFLLVSAIIPTASSAYPYFAALHVGLITSTSWCLLMNGFVGFQFAEDGTPLSLWSIRISSLVVCTATFFIAAATFNGWAGFDKTAPTALWIIYFVFNGAALVVYVVLQIVLVVNTLDDRWPLGDILFGSTFFIIGQIFLFAVSREICDTAKHYLDGLFFGTICNLLAVMMVYKYWDSITKEDLEFSVGGRQNVWLIDEVKESLLGDADRSDEYPPNNSSGFTGSTLSGKSNGSQYYQQHQQQSFNPVYSGGGGGGAVYGNQQYPPAAGYPNGYE